MFVKVHKGSGEVKTGNKGSCARLANYLEKEQDEKTFFSSEADQVKKEDIITDIDTNVKGLKNKEDKFYMISINPSEAEQRHIIMKTCGKDVKNIEQLTPEQKQKVYQELMSYTRDVMDIYAQNFNRPEVKNGNDLKYYARIETMRSFRHYDKLVQSGQYRPGELKPGLQLHVHVIVSRKSRDGKISLSPNAKSKGNQWELKGKQVRRGFNHEDFKIKSQQKFNQKSGYNFAGYANRTGKNGFSQGRGGSSWPSNTPGYNKRPYQQQNNSTHSRNRGKAVISGVGIAGIMKNQIIKGIKQVTFGESMHQVQKIVRGATAAAMIVVSFKSGVISLLTSGLIKYVKEMSSGHDKQAEK